MHFQKSLSSLILLLLIVNGGILEAQEGFKIGDRESLINIARSEGSVKVIVTLTIPEFQKLVTDSVENTVLPSDEKTLESEFEKARQSDARLAEAIATVSNRVISRLQTGSYTLHHTYSAFPFLALDVSEKALALLEILPEVERIEEDKKNRLILPVEKETVDSSEKCGAGGCVKSDKEDDSSIPLLNNTISLIGANSAWSAGYTGSGWSVAVLDTGIRRSHEFFAGKTIVEACFSSEAHCPNGRTSMYGFGAAAHYPSSYAGYDHGTHVAGIAAGRRSNGTLFGVARNANLIAVQVFSKYGSSVTAYTSDIIAGLNYVYSLRNTYKIASVNMSLGGGYYSSASACDSANAATKTAIDRLRNVGIATVVASGNDGNCYGISAPACISSAVAVGSTTKSDIESGFNNWHDTLLAILAPGSSIYSSTGASNSSYASWNGTSMATPHVAGAWAILKQKRPTAPVTEIFDALKSTGKPVITLCSSRVSKPRIRVNLALNAMTNSFLLWTRVSPVGAASIWSLNSAWATVGRNPYGVSGWQARSYQFRKDSYSHLLWTKPASGMASIWTLDKNGNMLSAKTYTAPGWYATSYQRRVDEYGHLLWTNPSKGLASIWTLDPNWNPLWSKVYAAGEGWLATSYIRRRDGYAHLLWSKPATGTASIWTLDPNWNPLWSKAYTAGAGWYATSYERRSDGYSYLLWSKPTTGAASIWTLDQNWNKLWHRNYNANGWFATSFYHLQTVASIQITSYTQAMGGNSTITIRKAGEGSGTVIVGDQQCGLACQEMTIPYIEGAIKTFSVSSDTDSYFSRWETVGGRKIEHTYYTQPGETIIAVFEKK